MSKVDRLISIEFTQNSLHVLSGVNGLTLELERLENGRLSEASKQSIISSLRQFLQGDNQPGRLTICAIPARGVSLRCLTLPNASRDDLDRLLLFQIEKEFPLSPDHLAWGYLQVPVYHPSNVRELAVMAVRKEILDDYSQILKQCGLDPGFVLACLARSHCCADAPEAYSILELGTHESELVCFKHGAPRSIQVLPWGTQELRSDPTSSLATLPAAAMGGKLYLSARAANIRQLATSFAQHFGGGVSCEPIEVPSSDGYSSATLGLQKAASSGAHELAVFRLGAKPVVAQPRSQASSSKWITLAAVLALAFAGLRAAETHFKQKRLFNHVADLKLRRSKLPDLDRELSLLQFIKTNQPAYLDVIFNVASAAPQGTRLESLAMNRHGELSIRGGMANAQQVVDFRSKLISSGYFSAVIVEEQTPTPDQQKINIRITAVCRAVPETKPKPAPVEEKIKSKPAISEPKGKSA